MFFLLFLFPHPTAFAVNLQWILIEGADQLANPTQPAMDSYNKFYALRMRIMHELN